MRSLEIIGEATKYIDDAFRALHPDVPWRDMARTRDRIIHGYDSVDYELVWNIIDVEIRPMADKIRAILAGL